MVGPGTKAGGLVLKHTPHTVTQACLPLGAIYRHGTDRTVPPSAYPVTMISSHGTWED